MEQFILLAKDFGPSTVLLTLVVYIIRLISTGQWIPKSTHDGQLGQMEKDRDYWRVTSEKWEKVAEGRINLILDQQEAVVSVTGHVVKAIRGEAGTSDEVVEK